MRRAGLPRLTLDLLTGGVAWVRSSDGLSGPRVTGAGVECGSARQVLAGQLTEHPLLGPVRCDVVLRGPEIRIRRIELPDVSPAVTRRVARRRQQEAAERDPSGATLLSSLIRTERRSSCLWLVTASRDVCESVDVQVGLQGVEADRLVPHALALGGLARLLPPADRLTAVLWLDREGGTCVVADRSGWLFDRAIPLRHTRDAASGDADQYVDRLATELDRTFTYVNRNLTLGEVRSVCLCGVADDLESLSATLATRLGLEVRTLESSLRSAGTARVPSQAGAALGAALLPRSARVANLLPEPVQRARRGARVRRPLKIALAAAVVVTVGAGTTGFARYRAALGELVRVRAVAARWELEREGLQSEAALRLRAEQIREAANVVSSPEPPLGEALVLLGDVLPASLFVRRLEVERHGAAFKLSASLEGEEPLEGDAPHAVGELRERLEESGLFRVAAIEPETASRADPDGSSLRYRLVAWLASERAGP